MTEGKLGPGLIVAVMLGITALLQTSISSNRAAIDGIQTAMVQFSATSAQFSTSVQNLNTQLADFRGEVRGLNEAVGELRVAVARLEPEQREE